MAPRLPLAIKLTRRAVARRDLFCELVHKAVRPSQADADFVFHAFAFKADEDRFARGLMDRHPPGPEQAVLADFVAEGHFARHLRRMRTLYAERQKALLDAAARHWGERITLAPEPAGMHLLGRLPRGVDDVRLSAAAERLGVEVPPLSRYAIRRLKTGGLVFGYAAYEPKSIEDAARRLAGALGGGA